MPVTENDLWRVLCGAPFSFCRQPRLPQHPALPATDPWIRRRSVRPIAGQDIQYTQYAENTVEPVLACCVTTKAICGGLLQLGIRQHPQYGHGAGELARYCCPIGLPSLA